MPGARVGRDSLSTADSTRASILLSGCVSARGVKDAAVRRWSVERLGEAHHRHRRQVSWQLFGAHLYPADIGYQPLSGQPGDLAEHVGVNAEWLRRSAGRGARSNDLGPQPTSSSLPLLSRSRVVTSVSVTLAR